MARPIDLQPTRSGDPIYRHLSRPADDATLARAVEIIGEVIEARRPGALAPASVDIARTRWIDPQEQPVLLPRSTRFAAIDASSLRVELGIDVYNPRDPGPDPDALVLRGPAPGWSLDRSNANVAPTARDAVGRLTVIATVEPDATPNKRTPLSVELTNGYSGRTTRTSVFIPARSIQYLDPAPQLDGLLGDWTAGDSIHVGPLTPMLDDTIDAWPDATLYAGWSRDALHLAFRVETSGRGSPRSSFLERQGQRPHADDVIEIVLAGDSGRPLLLSVRPTGAMESSAPTLNTEPGPMYVCTLQGRIWRGEVTVPMSLLGDVGEIVRLNVAQHRPDLGTGASWAGPVDQGLDTALMGVLRLSPRE
jgi:hypothetical protein